VNAESVLSSVVAQLRESDSSTLRIVICDLSASPFIDLAGSRMLRQLHSELARRGAALRIVGARGRVRDLLRADGVADLVGGLRRLATVDGLLGEAHD
jgi:MFS superfamily sulfate permease-like transporter